MCFCICRCKKNNPCEQFCNDTGSEVTCGCEARFILSEDGHSCLPVSAQINPPIVNDIKHDKPECPAGYKYNKTGQVCDGKFRKFYNLMFCPNSRLHT